MDITDEELNQQAEVELSGGDPGPVEQVEPDGDSLEALINQMEQQAAEPTEEEQQFAEEQAVSQSEENRRNAKRITQAQWTAISKFLPVAGMAMSEAYGQESVQTLPDKVKQGEQVWFEILEEHGGMPGFVDKALSNKYVKAGLYLGSSVVGAYQAQQMVNAQYAAEQAQQTQNQGEDNGEKREA